jgi:hypothetical protein
MSISALHGVHEIEKMFSEFGLGTEEEREQFRRLAHSYEYSTPSDESVSFGLGDSTAETCVSGENGCDAELA